jgi:hypothetical protein
VQNHRSTEPAQWGRARRREDKLFGAGLPTSPKPLTGGLLGDAGRPAVGLVLRSGDRSTTGASRRRVQCVRHRDAKRSFEEVRSQAGAWERDNEMLNARVVKLRSSGTKRLSTCASRPNGQRCEGCRCRKYKHEAQASESDARLTQHSPTHSLALRARIPGRWPVKEVLHAVAFRDGRNIAASERASEGVRAVPRWRVGLVPRQASIDR